MYIGEICRYVLLQPPQPTDTQHFIHKAVGNGLRPDIWSQFQKRFKIPKIMEFYGASESGCALMNLFGKVGAMGYIPVNFSFLLKVYIIKVDPTTGDVVRDSNGYCIEVSTNEKGEMVAVIDQNKFGRQFDGYKNKEATAKKQLHNVFKKGDLYYRTGDIVKMDEEGFIYFCDRTGDTFRWKGENVSTTEVENVIANIVHQRDVVVFGVVIPGAEGRIGMACIVGTPDSINISQLAKQLYPLLPAYAIPGFIRLVESTKITGTFRFRKNDYRKEGYNIKIVFDKLFVLDQVQKMYVPLQEDLYKEVVDGKFRF